MKNNNDLMIKAFIMLFLFIIGMIGYVCYYRGVFDNTSNNETEEEATKEKNIKDHLYKFVTAASIYSDTGYSSTAQAFYNGTNGIDPDIKYKMTYNVIVNIDQNYKSNVVLSTEEASKMTTIVPGDLGGEEVDVVKISDFNKVYEELFHEKPNYNLNTISNIGCPSPLGFNNDLDKMYLFYRCEGNSYSEYDSNIVSYDEDDTYYYVHQEGTFKSSIEESDVVVYKILWKFDKDLNFVSTGRE